MAEMRLSTLTDRVTAYFRKHAARYGLNPSLVEARYILNWGGFVYASFTITDGSIAYHLKLGSDEEQQESLQRWKLFQRRLVEQYRAPRMLEWVSIPRTPYAGLLFEHIPGSAVDYASQPQVLDGVLNLVARLHADPVLAQTLAGLDGLPGTCTEYFMDVYIDRFDEDLRVIAPDLPPFVDLPLLSWMMGEARELEGLARDLPAFQAPAASPTHGDLGTNNVLVTPAGEWYIIDWDDLALGDPALEYGIILGPLWRSGMLSMEEIHRRLPFGDLALRERFDLCLRAYLLDSVIDTLADWVECEFAPDYREEVRAQKEREHRESLELYRQIYAA